MPVTRKRKARSPEPTKQPPINKNISSYGRITKNKNVEEGTKKRKLADQVAISVTSSSSQSANVSETRTLPTKEDQQPPWRADPSLNQSRKRTREADEKVTTPQSKRFRNAVPLSPAETPSKTASKLFEKLNIETSSSNFLPSGPDEEAAYDTPPLTPRSFKSLGGSPSSKEPPAPVQDLVRLFSAFLTATSIFCAHHGTGAPIYLGALLPNVTKAWKKRAVTAHDARILFGIIGNNRLPFELADNGEGSLCLELLDNGPSAPGHFNQPELIQRFQQCLNKLWEDWLSTSTKAMQNVDGFLKQLPECTVVTSQLAPSNKDGTTRGKERLDDLKSGAVLARAAETLSRKPLVKAESRTTSAVSSRGSSLLDRILAKQQANSGRDSGPSQDELDRSAALDRVEDISRVLEVLANGKPRASFSTQTMVSHLQNSLRNPISAQEVERCLNLMADEIAPTFVSVIQAGQVRGIVITRAGKFSDAELKHRLEQARARGCQLT